MLALKTADPTFDPARNVLTNPLTARHRDSPSKNFITDPNSKAVVELFNGVYTTMILTFQQYFAFGGETQGQRDELNTALMRFMQEVLYRLGVFTTKLPAKFSADGTTAGPSFEFYGQYRLSAIPKVAWTVILEKLDSEIQLATKLATTYATITPSDSTLSNAAGTLTEIREALQAVRPT